MSDGLSAVYQFETGIDINTANQDDKGRLSNVGLSGGFGTLAVGRIWSASDNHVGSIIDNSHWLGADEVTGRIGNVISYSVDVGSVSLQADVVANNGGGAQAKAATSNPSATYHYIDANENKIQDANEPAVSTPVDLTNAKIATPAAAENEDIDSSQLGASLALGESGRIGLAYIDYDTKEKVKDKQSVVAAEYTIGGMTMYLGYGERDMKDSNDHTARTSPAANRIPQVATSNPAVRERKDKTTYFGVRGGVGDTGVSYLLQVRSKKSSGKVDVWDTALNTAAPNTVSIADNRAGTAKVSKTQPWFFSLKRSLGGGATVVLEHSNPDMDDTKSDTALILRVDF